MSGIKEGLEVGVDRRKSLRIIFLQPQPSRVFEIEEVVGFGKWLKQLNNLDICSSIIFTKLMNLSYK